MSVHPEIRALLGFLGAWQKENAVPPRVEQSFTEQRHWSREQTALKLPIEIRPDVRFEDRMIPTRGGERPVRVYHPIGSTAHATLIFAHGGGYAVGGIPDTHHEMLRLASATGATVVSISYRLAPEHPWPAGIDDAEDIVTAIQNNAIPEIATERLALGGISAGAGLMAAVARRLLAKGPSSVDLLIMLSPWLDMTGLLPSTDLFATGHGLEKPALDLFTKAYLSDDLTHDHVELSPARHHLPQGWPQTIMLSAECDPLADDAALFSRRLAEAHIPQAWRVAQGMIHAFHAWVGRVPAAQDETDWLDAHIRHWIATGTLVEP